jgi:hypothetical protein
LLSSIIVVRNQLNRILELHLHYRHSFEQSWSICSKPSYWNEEWDIAQRVADGTISIRSAHAYILRHQLIIVGYDNIYFQYQLGLIEESIWQNFRSEIKDQLKYDEPIVRAIFLKHARPEIRPLIEGFLHEIDTE